MNCECYVDLQSLVLVKGWIFTYLFLGLIINALLDGLLAIEDVLNIGHSKRFKVKALVIFESIESTKYCSAKQREK